MELSRKNCETILVAEDEEFVRLFLKTTLSKAGFKLMIAEDGEDPSFRARRIMEKYSVSTFDEAMAMIQNSDRERRKLVSKVTGKEWSDALNFDLSLDSGKIAQDVAFDVAFRAVSPFTNRGRVTLPNRYAKCWIAF